MDVVLRDQMILSILDDEDRVVVPDSHRLPEHLKLRRKEPA
jgi:hypothetical protein